MAYICPRSCRHAVQNDIERAEKKAFAQRNRGLTRDSRMTLEGALDRRTLEIFHKLKKAGFFAHLYGCIATGKESNVYAADADPASTEVLDKAVAKKRAVKVFHTSQLKFRRRREYVESDYRFRRGYQGCSNPRKMASQWAEKEFRNLRRLIVSGIRCPVPLQLRGHVFVMSLIGDSSDEAAPRLKDLICDDVITWKRCYIEVITIMRELYQRCKLIHGDFSEYNLLFYAGHPYIIDVSQSMDTSNNNNKRFLRRDCVNITQYFQQKVSDHYVQPQESINDSTSTIRNLFDDDTKILSRPNKLLLCTMNEEPVVTSKLAHLSVLLTLNELFEFITTEKSGYGDTDEEKIWWPEYDAHISQNDVLLWKQCSEDSKLGQKRVDTSLVSIESEHMKNAFVDTKDPIFDEFMSRRRHFTRLCQDTYEEVVRLTQSRTGMDGTEETLLEFLQQPHPTSLSEIRNLIQLEEEHEAYKRGEKTRYTCLLNSIVRPHSPTYREKDDSDKSLSIDQDHCDKMSSDRDDGKNKRQFFSSKIEIATKFNGHIPEGVDPKVWKKQVKEANRLRRETKNKKRTAKTKQKRC